jgi:uncharacterized cupredoxin-like copper-binding protein
VPYKLTFVILAASAAMLGGCQSLPGTAAADFIADGPAIVKAADWDKMQTVTVTMEEHAYGPTQLKLKAGQPYKIELKNVGDKDHYYTAPEFFKAVAWRKLMVNKQAEVKVDYVTATEVLKKTGQLDLYIVPVRKGTYTVYCTIEDHRDKGMEGQIVVE